MRNNYSDEVREYIFNNYQGKSNIDLSKEVNDKFGLNTTNDKISMLKVNIQRRKGINLRTGINPGCYKKGNVPINKGTKGMFNTGGNKTSFKKGNIPVNRREIFDERISKDDYIEIKVRDNHLNDNWELKHRYIYEQRYGKIPPKHKVIFADGNKRNFEIDNLILVSYSEAMAMMRNDLFKKDKELTRTGSILAKVIDKTNKSR